MASMKFMNLKSFHPGNKRNRKKKFIAEENAKNKVKKETERAREFQEEQEFIKNRELLTGSKIEGERVKVGFLYAPPPGYSGTDINNTDNNTVDDGMTLNTKKKDLTDLEKFPFLAGAPVAGDYTDTIKVTHKPFGIQLRDVKCVRCNQFGHKSGDRECPLLEINPQESKRLLLEDPLYFNNNNVNRNNVNNNNNNNFKFNNNLRVNPNTQSTKSFGPKEYQSSYLNEYLEGEEELENEDEVERKFLSSLTSKQRKLLYRQIKLEEKQKKKRKLESSDSSDSSDSSSESDREYRKKKKYKKSKKNDS